METRAGGVRADERERSPRALLIAHDFPPSSGSGAFRASAFARYLPLYGWWPLVLTVAPPWAPNRDDALLHSLPTDLRVIRTRSGESRPNSPPFPARVAAAPSSEPPASTQAVMRKPGAVRRHIGHLKRFPDAHLGWLPYALAAALRVDFDLLHTTSGPFTSHLLGLLVHRLTGKPWVAELRDGWYRWNRAIFPDYPAWRGALEQRLESAVVRSARAVVLVTERMRAAFAAQYADLPHAHFRVVSNGFDPAELTPPAAAADTQPETFEMVHSGALYYGRSIAAFLDAAADLAGRDARFADAFGLRLIGTLDATAQRELAQHRLASRIRVDGQLGHAATVEAMRQASALLLVANTTPGAEATVPGKLFEYLALSKPVFAIAPPASSTNDVLGCTGGGWLAPAGDVAGIACTLERAFAAHLAGAPNVPDPARVARFDRRLLTRDLAALFDEVLAARRL